MINNLPAGEVAKARQRAVRNVEDLKPGLYYHYFPEYFGGSVADVAVVWVDANEGMYGYVSIMNRIGNRAPTLQVGYLSDAGVQRSKDGYLGINFLVPNDNIFDVRK